MNKHAKSTSVVLAVVLQIMPMARQAVTQIIDFVPNIAVLLRWGIGATALLGSVDAVSGVSTVITSPLTATGTNGVPFTYRILTGPQVANSYSASPLPPGLTLNTGNGRITGTPAQVGVTQVTLIGCAGGNGCTPPATLTLTIVAASGGGTPPSITTQPTNLTVTAGSSATFNVTAAGTAPLSYQWRFNSANIGGPTAGSYTLANAQAANAGSYSVLVSNAAGSVTSANATLTVNPAPVAPSINTPPASQTVTAGANVSFSVTTTGTAPLSYQWQFNGANVGGATSSSYALNNVQAANAGNYSVLVSNAVGSVTSANATLTVNPAPVAPGITTQPSPQTVTAGANVSFTVTATGTAPLFYQWKFNGANIGGATSSSYALNNVQAANAGNYSVLVSNVAGSVTSSSAALTVSAGPVAPSITTQPSSQTVTAGANVSFSVAATGTAPFSYQWRFNGADIPGATASGYAMNNVQAANAGSYSVFVSNAVGSVTSANAALTINPAPIAPSITTQPVSQTVTAGVSVSFSVTATGTAPLSYQWRSGGAKIPGATGSTYTLNNAQAGNAGAYSVVVSNAAGTATSADAALTVLPPPPVAPAIMTHPASRTVTLGSSASFTVLASGTGPLSYQWRLNGVEIPGATSTTFTIASVQNSDVGSYDVLVSNSVGSVTSATATLTVTLAGPSAGVYQGLFYDTNDVTLANSGYLRLTLRDGGAYAATLQAGSERIVFKGQFDGAGHAVATQLGTRSLTVEMQLDLINGTDQLAGRLTDGNWEAMLVADRGVFTSAPPAPFAGNYDLALQGNGVQSEDAREDSESDHGGNGRVRVTSKGILRFSGKLTENLKLKQNSAVSKTGEWPFYVVLPKGKGVVIGWVNFSPQSPKTLTGDLLWLHPDGSSTPLTVLPAR